MALTGFILFGFVVGHMLGNLQIFLGQDALNDYAEHLHDLPLLLWPARVFLLISLVLHIGVAAVLTVENRRARGKAYAVKDAVVAGYASKTMMLSGVIILFFAVYHLLHYTFGIVHCEFFGLTDAQGRMDVYSMVVRSYQNYGISGVYIAAMFPLCLHLSHGLSSFPQSLGFDVAKHERLCKSLAYALTLIIFIGNSSIPAAVLLGFIRLPAGA